MFDWQTVAAALAVLAACLYVARRAWARVRSMRAGGTAGSSCETGCGKCGDDEAGARATVAPKPLVQIGRAKDVRRRAG